jgi:hypothetical protein
MKRNEPAPQVAVSATRTQRKVLEASHAVYFQPQPDNDDLVFSARELVQATMPHSSPRGNPPIWSRTNGNYTLLIKPGYKIDRQTGNPVCVGYPYGTIPRLLLFWIATEAVRTGTRRLELGDTLAGFMRELGLDPSRGGPRSDAQRLRIQMERLFRSTISFDYTIEGHTKWLDMQIAPKGELWWDPKQPDQTALFGSWIELGEQFYEAVTKYPVPLDMRALKALKKSPLALDLYAWLAYRSFRASQAKDRKSVFVPWKLLQEQFGAEYKSTDDFKRKLKMALRKVIAIYHGLHVEDVSGGLRLSPSHSLIAPR